MAAAAPRGHSGLLGRGTFLSRGSAGWNVARTRRLEGPCHGAGVERHPGRISNFRPIVLIDARLIFFNSQPTPACD